MNTGPFVTSQTSAAVAGRFARLLFAAFVALSVAGCSGFNLFGPAKIKQEEIIPPETLYQQALDDMDRQYFIASIEKLKKLERQHPN